MLHHHHHHHKHFLLLHLELKIMLLSTQTQHFNSTNLFLQLYKSILKCKLCLALHSIKALSYTVFENTYLSFLTTKTRSYALKWHAKKSQAQISFQISSQLL